MVQAKKYRDNIYSKETCRCQYKQIKTIKYKFNLENMLNFIIICKINKSKPELEKEEKIIVLLY
jgi:hypothetical protein